LSSVISFMSPASQLPSGRMNSGLISSSSGLGERRRQPGPGAPHAGLELAERRELGAQRGLALDLDATLRRHQDADRAGSRIEQQRDIGLDRRSGILLDAHRAHRLAAHAHRQDLARQPIDGRAIGGLADRARLAAPAGRDLTLDDPGSRRQRLAE
jgi:hypothetical protein